MDYQVVDQAPDTVHENEMVVELPNFIEQIQGSAKRRGTSGHTTVNYVRDILMLITDKYDNTINPYTLPLNTYEGLAFSSDEELSEIILRIINDHNLGLLSKAIDFDIKNRPSGVNMIYFVSPDSVGEDVFISNGFNRKNVKKTIKKDTVV